MSDLARLIDHTLLRPEATREEIDRLCQEAQDLGFAAVCVNPVWVERCAERLRGSAVKVCGVVAFPLGAHLSEVKAHEARRAVEQGADEVDMVIHLGALKGGDDRAVESDLRGVVEAVAPRAIVKAILETSLLTREEIVRGARLAEVAGARFVKTGTGFAAGGATVETVELLRSVLGLGVGIKAAGGIRTHDQALALVRAGATRLGTSAGVRIVRGAPPGVGAEEAR